MLYVWLTTSFFFILSVLSQATSGSIPILFNVLTTLFFEIGAVVLLSKKVAEPNKVQYSLFSVGFWAIYFSIFMGMTYLRARQPYGNPYNMELVLLIGSFGMCLYYYLKKKYLYQQSRKTVMEIKAPVDQNDDKLLELVFEIKYLLSLSKADNNTEFALNLRETENIIQQIRRKKIFVRNSILDQVIDIFESYCELYNEPIETAGIRKCKDGIEQIAGEIKTAFQVIYETALQNEIDKIDVKVKTLSNQIHLNGLTKSDF